MRISRDAMLMEIAATFAKRTTCRRAPDGVGAVISRGGRVISSGYAGTPPGAIECGPQCDLSVACTRTTHAEANAILFAARYGSAIDGCTMHCTLEPCESCAKLIVNAGIRRLVYRDDYRTHEGLVYLEANGIELMKWFP